MRESTISTKTQDELSSSFALRIASANELGMNSIRELAESGEAGPSRKDSHRTVEVAASVLTGGADRPYAFGLASSLMSKRVKLDLIVCDELVCPPFQDASEVNLLNLRGSVDPNVNGFTKLMRVLLYYCKLILYVLRAKPKIFHILWNNKFEWFDRTLIMLYYRLLGKQTVLTVHNVNKLQRDSKDSRFNRLTLRIQYRLAEHLFVHTETMKTELVHSFGVQEGRITVIPFGMNNSVPITELTSDQARQKLGIRRGEKTLLFFGHITPYKGLEYLVEGFHKLSQVDGSYRLIIAGRPKDCEEYWAGILDSIADGVKSGRIILQSTFVPDEHTEIYFKAADVFVLPYRYIYQSGVLFLGLSFGLPALVSNVGTLKDEIVEGKTGFAFNAEDSEDLVRAAERYFASDLYLQLDRERPEIRRTVERSHSWDAIAETTVGVYRRLLDLPVSDRENRQISESSIET